MCKLKKLTARLEFEPQTILGEGPIWHHTLQTLFFVDIESHTILSYNPVTRNNNRWVMPSYVSTLAIHTGNWLIAGVKDKLLAFNFTTDQRLPLVELDLPDKNLRFNDGKCDKKGRFWIGTMHLEAKFNAGSLYRVDVDGKVNIILDHLTIPNGLCWSEDDTYFYFIDSARQQVQRFDFDQESGQITNPEVILQFNNPDEKPDGMCIDRNGYLWIAFWGTGRIGGYDPTSGKHLFHISVAAPHVTSCAFGGNDFSTLYITTARNGLSASQLKDFPKSGGIFSCRTGTTGYASNNFTGNVDLV